MTDVTVESDRAFALVVQPDGKLVAAGGCDVGSTFDSCLARYDALGNLDASFGVGGKVVTDLGGIGDHDGISGLVLQPDGKLVAAGKCDGASSSNFCAARYNGDPTPAIENLIFQITSNAAVPDNLAGPLHQTISILTDNNPRNDVAACGSLRALVNQVNVSEKSGRLTAAQAAGLRGSAQGVRSSLSCR